MSFKKNFKRNLLNKSDMYNFYKSEYEECNKNYQNILHEFDNINTNNLIKHKILNAEIDELKENQFKCGERIIPHLSNKNFLITEFINEEDEDLLNSLKIANFRILDQNKFLTKENFKLRNAVKVFSELNESLMKQENIEKDDLINFYQKELDFYKNEYEELIKKQNDYDLFFNEILNNSLDSLNKRQKFFEILKYEDIYPDLNIAYVLIAFPTLSETFILNELKWLKNNGYNVKVFSYYNPPNPVTLDFDLEVIRFDGDLSNNLEKLLIEHDIDIMHTHFVYPVGTQLTHPIAEKLKIPFTLFAHAYDIFMKVNDERNNIAEIANSEYCKGIFTLSEYHKNYLLKRGVPNDKIIITRQATEYNIKPLKQKNNKIKNIISISRFVEKKGLDILIDSAKLLEDEDLTFSIYGFGNLQNDLQQQINDLNLKNTSILGSLNGAQEVEQVFNQSDLFIAPCRIAKNGDRDGIPTVIFESMAYGVPVLTTNVSAIPEVIKDHENGFLIEPNDPVAMKNKIKEIMSLTPEQLFEIRKNAQKDVQSFSSIAKTTHTLLNTWKTV